MLLDGAGTCWQLLLARPAIGAARAAAASPAVKFWDSQDGGYVLSSDCEVRQDNTIQLPGKGGERKLLRCVGIDTWHVFHMSHRFVSAIA